MNRSYRLLLVPGVFALSAAFAACSDAGNTDYDAGTLPDADAGADGGRDATSGDAGNADATTDGGADATSDGGADATSDGGADATSDASGDATGDSAVDASDGGGDAATDAGAGDADAGTTDAADDGSDAAADAGDDASDAANAGDADAGATDAAADVTDAGDAADAPVFVAPTCDGVIGAGEYGVHTDGQNQQSTATATWYMTWNDTNVYVAIAGANVTEGAVLYFSAQPSLGIDAGTNADGTIAGFAYDNERVATLPLHGLLAAYVKDSYNETRASDGAGGWANPSANALTVCTSGTTREFSVPWAAITVGGRPASFGWIGLVTSSGGFVYGEVPTDNPGGQIGTSAIYAWYYAITNATPLTGDMPFATKLSR